MATDADSRELDVLREENAELKLEMALLKDQLRDLEMHVMECDRTGD